MAIKVIILAGGRGRRLWPLSTKKCPKQFCKIFFKKTLIEKTFHRVKDLGKVTIVAPKPYLNRARSLLGNHVDYLEEAISLNTGRAIYLSAQNFNKSDHLIFFPADHWIRDPTPLFEAIKNANSSVQNGKIVTFGIKPSYPSKRLGYIEMGEDNAITNFFEKPDRNRAKQFMKKKNIFWNMGIFFSQAETILKEWEKYGSSKALPFDKIVMERTNRGAIFPVELDWEDLGTLPSFLKRIFH